VHWCPGGQIREESRKEMDGPHEQGGRSFRIRCLYSAGTERRGVLHFQTATANSKGHRVHRKLISECEKSHKVQLNRISDMSSLDCACQKRLVLVHSDMPKLQISQSVLAVSSALVGFVKDPFSFHHTDRRFP
jgi:hypothetical protein